jgi:hypothetical protein
MADPYPTAEHFSTFKHLKLKPHLSSSHNGISRSKKRLRYVTGILIELLVARLGMERSLTLAQALLVFDQLFLPAPFRHSPHLSRPLDQHLAFRLKTQRRRLNRSSTLCQATPWFQRPRSFRRLPVPRSTLLATNTMS